MLKFAIRCLLVTAALCGFFFLISFKKPDWDMRPFFGGAAYLCLLSFLVHYISRLGLGKSNTMFMKAFYTGLYLQLFLGLAAVLLWLLFSIDKNVPFVVTYAFMFVVYEVLVVYHFMQDARQASK